MNKIEEKADEIVKMLQESGLSFDDQIQVIRIAREKLEAKKLKIVMKNRKEPKVIDVIRDKIIKLHYYSVKPDTMVVSKDMERKMFLDGSFQKGDNYENTIQVDEYKMNFIVVEGTEIIKVLWDGTFEKTQYQPIKTPNTNNE